VLEALLDKYADEGVDDIENLHVLKVQPLTALGTPVEIVKRFGGKDAYVEGRPRARRRAVRTEPPDPSPATR
jgi:type I site-specific restriction endonuclease